MERFKGRLRMGMVGGGRDAFIGAVHRAAIRLDDEIELVAGALSSSPAKAMQSGQMLGLSDDRNYPSWQAMLEAERKRAPGNRIDLVSIVTPNASHFEIASAFAEAGFHLVIDKPMVTTLDQANELCALVKKRNLVCCVTYNYSGYPMVKQAREMVSRGELGAIRKVMVEYTQGWLATPLEQGNHKQASWRTNPQLAGLGGAICDIGSHAEHLAGYITGLRIESICAELSTCVAGRKVDDDANVLLRFEQGARGVLIASQICTGERNNLRIRVWGDKAGLEWRQEEPNHLMFRTIDGPERTLHRGEAYLCDAAKRATRLPPGHSEAFIEAFANVYRGAAAAIRNRSSSSEAAESVLDFPTAEDGLKGVRFIEAALRSNREGGVWVPLDPAHL